MPLTAKAVAGAVALAALAGGISAAPAATSGATLVLKKVTDPPPTATAGDEVTMKVRIVNRSRVHAGRGAFTMTLTGGPAPYSVPRRIGRFPTGRIDIRSYKRFRIRFTVPPASRSGVYRVRTCLKVFGRPGKQCRVSSPMAVTAL